MPVIIEVVETQESLDTVLPKIDGLMQSGLITMEKVKVIRYAHKHERR